MARARVFACQRSPNLGSPCQASMTRMCARLEILVSRCDHQTSGDLTSASKPLGTKSLGRFAFGKTLRGPRWARQARQRLAKKFGQVASLTHVYVARARPVKARAVQGNYSDQSPSRAAHGHRRCLKRHLI